MGFTFLGFSSPRTAQKNPSHPSPLISSQHTINSASAHTFSRVQAFDLSRIVVRALGIFLVSASAVCFPFFLRHFLWPEGLTAWADNIFWPATGVNTAALLLCGRRYWPVLLFNALPAWLLLSLPFGGSLLGASANAAEAWIAAWAVTRFGSPSSACVTHLSRAPSFDHIRTVVVLLIASFVAPLTNTLTFPVYLVATGVLPAADFLKALGNLNLANGSALLLLTPALVALTQRPWIFPRRSAREVSVWLGLGLLGGAVALSAVFEGAGLNFAFLLFPFVIFVAARFGPKEVAASLAGVMALVYGVMVFHATRLPPAQMPAILWFLQAFCWVLAATGLLVAALVQERAAAEAATVAEQARTLEVSLREERARLDALRYQINPHFLFNALNSLRSTLPLSAPVSRDMITALAGYLRGTLDHSDADLTSIALELRSIENYLAIEKIRFGENLKVVIVSAPAADSLPIPVFLLQPLVENALRHGFETSRGVFYLHITSSIAPAASALDSSAAGSTTGASSSSSAPAESQLVIEVANTGLWRPPVADARPGLGLANIHRRLALLYGATAASLTRADTADGWVRFRITIPVSKS